MLVIEKVVTNYINRFKPPTIKIQSAKLVCLLACKTLPTFWRPPSTILYNAHRIVLKFSRYL